MQWVPLKKGKSTGQLVMFSYLIERLKYSSTTSSRVWSPRIQFREFRLVCQIVGVRIACFLHLESNTCSIVSMKNSCALRSSAIWRVRVQAGAFLRELCKTLMFFRTSFRSLIMFCFWLALRSSHVHFERLNGGRSVFEDWNTRFRCLRIASSSNEIRSDFLAAACIFELVLANPFLIPWICF